MAFDVEQMSRELQDRFGGVPIIHKFNHCVRHRLLQDRCGISNWEIAQLFEQLLGTPHDVRLSVAPRQHMQHLNHQSRRQR